MNVKKISWISTTFALCAVAFMQGCASTPRTVKDIDAKKKVIEIHPVNNADFYTQKGALDVEKAKQAYFNLMTRFNYPIYIQLKTEAFNVTDFGLNDFAHVGKGCTLWVNKNYPTGGYFAREIFLLPGQMIAEQKNVASEMGAPKHATLLVRYGSIYSFSVENTLGFFPDGVQVPKSQEKFTKSNNCKLVHAGELFTIKKEDDWHFIMAGPDGAIVTEFSTFFDPQGRQYSNPNIKH